MTTSTQALAGAAAIAVVVAIAIAALTPESRDRAAGVQILAVDDVGCPTLEGFDRIGRLAMDGDEVAVQRFMRSAGCRPFSKGDRARLDEASLTNLAGCLRPAGDTKCYWLADRSFRLAD